MAQWTLKDSSLLVAVQDDYKTPVPASTATEKSKYRSLACEISLPSLSTDIQEIDVATGVPAGSAEKVVGSRHGGEISFRIPLQGLAFGAGSYVPGIDSPGSLVPGSSFDSGAAGVCPEWLALAASQLGANTQAALYAGGVTTAQRQDKFWSGEHLQAVAYNATGLDTGSTTSVAKVDDGSLSAYEPGAMVALESAAGVVSSFVKGKTDNGSGNADDLTFFEDSEAAGAANGAVYGALTSFTSSDQQAPLSMILLGVESEMAIRLCGAIGTGLSLSLESGAVPVMELKYTFTDYEMIDAGGLVSPTKRPRTAPILGTKGGFLKVDGAKRCGLSEVSLDVEIENAYTKCHSAAQGVSSATTTRRTVRFSATVPYDSADAVTAGAHLWQSKLENGTDISFSVNSGKTAGSVFSMLIPAANLSAVPNMSDDDGRVAFTLEAEAGVTTGDDAAGVAAGNESPANSVLRIGVA